MNEKLLSIVVPTKNRYEYLKAFIDLCSTFDKGKFELVIQDNSDDKGDIEEYIKEKSNLDVVYNYVKESIPVIKNSELAIMHSKGKYVCFMGDDDLLSKYILDIVEKMDIANVDSIIFNKAVFNWPGVKYKSHNFPSLIVPHFTGNHHIIDSTKEYNRLLKCGATELGLISQLYHGVIKRSVLDEIKNQTGTFFPGPSPDMAVATCLSCFTHKHVFFDAPLVSSGKSPKSTAGLGAKHEHKGQLKDMPFLPSDIEQKWDRRLPFIWTGPTIYAQSAIEAIKSMGREDDLKDFNFTYFFAYFDTFCSEYKEQSRLAKENTNIKKGKYTFSLVCVFILRAKEYIKNKLLLSFHLGGSLFDNVKTCVEAERIIDKEIESTLNLNAINFNKGY